RRRLDHARRRDRGRRHPHPPRPDRPHPRPRLQHDHTTPHSAVGTGASTMTTTILPTDTDQLRQIATDGVRAMIALTGDDPTRPGVRETPRRVVDALLDMTDQPGDPETLLGKVFNDVEHASEQITVGPIH